MCSNLVTGIGHHCCQFVFVRRTFREPFVTSFGRISFASALHSRSLRRIRAAASDGKGPGPADKNKDKDNVALIPAKPKSAVGEVLAYYYQEAPHLLKPAIEDQLERLRDEKEADEKKDKDESATADNTDLVLFRRIEEVKLEERSSKVEDLMYAAVLAKFAELGVEMLPRIDDYVHTETVTDLKILTEGVHSREAVELVKEHVLSVLGPASGAFSNTMLKMSKLQGAQVYAASLMFGYFLRRVDKRFQLERAIGVLPQTPEDAVERLNKLFSQAASMEESDDPDSAPIPEPSDPEQPTASSSSSSATLAARKKNPLRSYVENFDQSTVIEMTRVVSLEGAGVIEAQTTALFGDIKELQRQMQEAVGSDARSMEEVMQRIQDAVAQGTVDCMSMTVGTQRRAVLEAVAFGAFLWDVEGWVDSEYGLLTLAPRSSSSGGGPTLLGA